MRSSRQGETGGLPPQPNWLTRPPLPHIAHKKQIGKRKIKNTEEGCGGLFIMLGVRIFSPLSPGMSQAMFMVARVFFCFNFLSFFPPPGCFCCFPFFFSRRKDNPAKQRGTSREADRESQGAVVVIIIPHCCLPTDRSGSAREGGRVGREILQGGVVRRGSSLFHPPRSSPSDMSEGPGYCLPLFSL